MCWMPRTPSPASAWAPRSSRLAQFATDGQGAPEHPPEEVSLILHNGTVRTMLAGAPVAEAIAVRGGRIAAVGSSEEVLALAGRDTRLVDLDGRVAVPGLNDSHLHQVRAAADGPKVPLDGARSIADVVAILGDRARRTPAGEWVESRTLWHESLLAERRLPTRADLDRVPSDHPVYLPRGGHVAIVNSRALAMAGISRDTPDPEGGTIVRDASGEPTGVLLERARDLMSAVLPAESGQSEQTSRLAAQMAELNSMGVTSVTDPGVLPDELDAYLTLREAGSMTVRTHLLLRVHDLDGLAAAAEALSPRSGDELLRFDGFKYSLDGGVEGAAFVDPYQIVPGEQTDPEYRGELILPPGGHEELAQMYLRAAQGGFQFQTHNVGDASAEALMEHYERVDRQVPLKALRWVAVHLSMPTPRVIETMLRLGIVSTMQDNAVLLGRNQLRWWGEQRAHAANPIRTVIDAGIVVGGGTDGPVVPLSPFLSMWWMTTRGMLQGGALGADQAITGEEALHLYTVGSAATQCVDHQLGTLEIGKLADIAVLDRDPTTVAPELMRDITCQLTILGGVPVFER